MKPSTNTHSESTEIDRDGTEYVVGLGELAPRVVAVEAQPETWAVLATFETGEQRRFNLNELRGRGIWAQIEESGSFEAISVVEGGGGIEWEAGPDLSADTLYLGGQDP